MLGSAMMRGMSDSKGLEIYGTIRSGDSRRWFAPPVAARLIEVRDVRDYEALAAVFAKLRPNAIINCISPNRDSLRRGDPLALIPLCALFPHQLAKLCGEEGARLVHFSTDGVFSGTKAGGGYTEDDVADASDMYGLAKRLGEVAGAHTITLRTSMIGHELGRSDGLLEWFLSQTVRCKCFSRAVFSGLPTVALAQIVRDCVLPRPELSGVYHVGAQPITKCELLEIIARTYGKEIEIVRDDGPAIDRSLDTERFKQATGFVAPSWPTLVQTMHSFR